MHPLIRKQGQEAGFEEYQLTIVTATVEEYAIANPTAPLFDWVIFGNVLCEVDSQQSTLIHIHKLLKPGGHVYFSEHVAAPRDTRARQIQDCCNPLWSRISGGCNCNRDSLHALEGMAEWEVVSWEMSHIKVMFGPFVMGLAQKVQRV
jgi:SAM-dependent methyltransferase